MDTSIWIDYFKGAAHSKALDYLIDENLIVSNEIILAELIPYLKLKRQTRLVQLLQTVTTTPLKIDWKEIILLQSKCLSADTNGIGIPDLIIAQNAKQHGSLIYTLDKHFSLLKNVALPLIEWVGTVKNETNHP
ncbi:MAG: PIN domain-containing protein [Xanthomonadales bacterium]|nr:PIN domain-containing protein [Xanthomonadales bacterium]